jgi:DNA-binding IclR family transcriptional regulator
MLYREPNGRGYRLGYLLIRWGILSQASISLRSLALPVLHQLAAETGESAILSVRVGYAGIWIEMIESRHPVRLAMRVGQHLQLHAGASSKVLWAFLPPARVEDILAHIELKPLCTQTITDKALLLEELERIRQRGYATSFEETDPGAMGVAAPVFDHSGQPVAGIGVAAPINRVPPARVPEIAGPVVAASQQLSRLLGAP